MILDFYFFMYLILLLSKAIVGNSSVDKLKINYMFFKAPAIYYKYEPTLLPITPFLFLLCPF